MPTLRLAANFTDITEAGLPDIRLPPLPLPAAVLMVLSRISWAFGRGQGCETYAAFKDRAQDAARALINISADHKCVVLVGHGMLNRHIARYLLANGYTGSTRPSSKHWDCTTYTPATPLNNSRN